MTIGHKIVEQVYRPIGGVASVQSICVNGQHLLDVRWTTLTCLFVRVVGWTTLTCALVREYMWANRRHCFYVAWRRPSRSHLLVTKFASIYIRQSPYLISAQVPNIRYSGWMDNTYLFVFPSRHEVAMVDINMSTL